MGSTRNHYIKISPSKARRLLMEDPYIVLIDVRTPEEYDAEHIPGSINIPVQAIAWEIHEVPICLFTPLIVYCKTGIRACEAASILTRIGFQTVYTFGGIQKWPYETVCMRW